VVLTEANAINADFVGEHGLVDNVADHLRLAQRLSVTVGLNVAKGVETKFNFSRHRFVLSIPI
jgi:hypothetical protein